MRRFLVLYTHASTHQQHYAEGLIHYDGSVYLRNFFAEGEKLFYDMCGMRNHLRDNEDMTNWHIYMIDPVEVTK